MKKNLNTAEIEIGLVGLGLMGSSIVVALLVAGHRVKAIAPIPSDKDTGPFCIRSQLERCVTYGLLSKPIEEYLSALTISQDYALLSNCQLVLECVLEDEHIKEQVFKKIVSAVDRDTIIASNTSAIPISTLQEFVKYSERFIGIHWAEPAYLTRFLEIICGSNTSFHTADWVFELAHYWGKEPTLLRKDIRGFITNRLMYSVYRESLFLVEKGLSTLEDVDKAFRYDAGSWMTLMGVFQRMDFMGLKDYLEIFRTIFPMLMNDETVPYIMQRAIDINARGTQNFKGLYEYTEEEARNWDDAFAAFNLDIYQLAASYPSKVQ